MAGVRKRPQPNGKYQGWFTDYLGKRRFVVGTHKQAETRRMAERFEDDHRQIRLGYRPAPKNSEKQAKRPFSETVKEYLEWGRAQGGRGGRGWSDLHAKLKAAKLKWWAKQLGLETLADLPGILPRVEAALRGLQDKGRAGKTLEHYRETLKSFCLWAERRGFIEADPLRGMAKFDDTPKTQRRALGPAEIRRLLGVAPPHRAILYETAIASGLRANELRNLTPDHLDEARSALRLDAEWTKNRRPGFQPISPDLLARLRAYAATGEAKRLTDKHYKRHTAREGLPNPTSPVVVVSRLFSTKMPESFHYISIVLVCVGMWKPKRWSRIA